MEFGGVGGMPQGDPREQMETHNPTAVDQASLEEALGGWVASRNSLLIIEQSQRDTCSPTFPRPQVGMGGVLEPRSQRRVTCGVLSLSLSRQRQMVSLEDDVA